MTDAARGSRPRNQPNLASTDAAKGTDKDSSISQQRPALRFYEPLPLGSDAFMAPLAPPPEPRAVNGRRLAVYCILGGALGIAFGGAALAFLSNTGTERPLSVRVMDVPPPAEAARRAAHPVKRAHARARARARCPCCRAAGPSPNTEPPPRFSRSRQRPTRARHLGRRAATRVLGEPAP